MELAAESPLAGNGHCSGGIGRLSFERRDSLGGNRADGRREPDDCPQGLSGINGLPRALTKPFCEFLASTPAIVASGEAPFYGARLRTVLFFMTRFHPPHSPANISTAELAHRMGTLMWHLKVV